MQKITPFLWFNGNAEAAMHFYVSIFKNSKVGRVTRYGDAGPGPKGTVISATFQLEGQEFFALSGGPQFSFTPSKDQCGWLKDKFGLSWQIVPSLLGRLLGDRDPQKANRVMKAMMQMQKLDIKGLQQAYDRG